MAFNRYSGVARGFVGIDICLHKLRLAYQIGEAEIDSRYGVMCMSYVYIFILVKDPFFDTAYLPDIGLTDHISSIVLS